MADIKSVYIQVERLEAGSGPSFEEILDNGAVFSNYVHDKWPPSNLESEATEGVWVEYEEIFGRLQSGQELSAFELGAENSDAKLSKLLDASDRRTTFAIASPNRLAFYGFGVSGGRFDSPARFLDIFTTMAMIGEFYLGKYPSGSVLFEALKNPNFKQTQIGKLKAALARLEKMLKRDDREPWDKHDCA
ncbi:MAG: hypothetical protein LBT62_03610 [Deltaproteobacteria bacterium]|jgi:hypothetical protein|nr:hypothetical protein [Deltaproteobacteria bacterium]